MGKTLIVIPTFNERENVNPLLNRIFSLKILVDVLILDDNSPDGTKNIVLENKKKYKKRLHLISRKKKNGLGRAYIQGFRWALERKYEKIIQMDADLSHPPEKLTNIINELDFYDYVIGSRYINGIRVLNWPLNRILLSICASWYVKLITGLPVKDSTAGFVGYNRSTLLSLNLDDIMFVGYAFQIEMKFKLWKLGYKFIEIPITFKNRTRGESKMNSSIISEAIYGVIIIKFKSLFKND
tara:strand:+ start:2534 stop:3253 length:720 start_codon:yes stop_codon:yes gene_type:complete